MGHDEQEYTKSFEWASWKKLLPFVRPFRKTILMVLILNLICAMVDIALPLFQRYAIDNFIEAGTVEALVPFGLVYAAVIVDLPLPVPPRMANVFPAGMVKLMSRRTGWPS